MTPVELSVLIHYHAHTCDWRNGCGEIFEKLVKEGLLTTSFKEAALQAPWVNQKYYPTERLHAFVRMLCETPLPVQKWVRPQPLGTADLWPLVGKPQFPE